MDNLLQAPVEWEVVDVTPVKGPMGKFQIPQTAIDSVNSNGIGLKGPLMTPVGKGHQSLNLALRKYVTISSSTDVTCNYAIGFDDMDYFQDVNFIFFIDSNFCH